MCLPQLNSSRVETKRSLGRVSDLFLFVVNCHEFFQQTAGGGCVSGFLSTCTAGAAEVRVPGRGYLALGAGDGWHDNRLSHSGILGVVVPAQGEALSATEQRQLLHRTKRRRTDVVADEHGTGLDA